MNRLTLILSSLLAIAMLSCDYKGEFSGYAEIADDGWPYGERLAYTIDLGSDSVAMADVELTLTHDNSYEYSNLWIEVSYDTPSGELVDTVNVPMCDVYGNWYGKGLPGYYQLVYKLTPHQVQLVDSGRIVVRHIMRVDTLGGITQVGVRGTGDF
ncbi:MAG: gliding motility lipoprotein GldH [Clostridiales bacterium]|nr:gliding motility lipoprotein GldH [Clostridiales bacterium]